MNLGTAQVIRGDARNLPLADNSVDLVVTSPPYFALRSYQDGGEHYAGQIGAEPTPAEFVAALLDVTRECVRVLKPSGSLWVNLGDKYAGVGGPNQSGDAVGDTARRQARTQNKLYDAASRNGGGVRSKSLFGIPWRYALACIDDLGLILRAEVIWSKPNGLPESVTDRVRRSHEQWFHFTLSPRYFSAVDEIREAQKYPNHGQIGKDARGSKWIETPGGHADELHHVGRPATRELHPLGKLPGSVWTVPTEPLRVPDHLGIDHFAAFPTEWPRRIIQGWSPDGVCVECGEGRRPVSGHAPWWKAYKEENGIGDYLSGSYTPGEGYDQQAGRQRANNGASIPSGPKTVITGYACACAEPIAPTTPAVILDPFGGTGTTALVAKALGRHGITADMSADYCRLAEWRTNDRNQIAKVLGIEKAAPADDNQLDLFGEIA